MSGAGRRRASGRWDAERVGAGGALRSLAVCAGEAARGCDTSAEVAGGRRQGGSSGCERWLAVRVAASAGRTLDEAACSRGGRGGRRRALVPGHDDPSTWRPELLDDWARSSTRIGAVVSCGTVSRGDDVPHDEPELPSCIRMEVTVEGAGCWGLSRGPLPPLPPLPPPPPPAVGSKRPRTSGAAGRLASSWATVGSPSVPPARCSRWRMRAMTSLSSAWWRSKSSRSGGSCCHRSNEARLALRPILLLSDDEGGCCGVEGELTCRMPGAPPLLPPQAAVPWGEHADDADVVGCPPLEVVVVMRPPRDVRPDSDETDVDASPPVGDGGAARHVPKPSAALLWRCG